MKNKSKFIAVFGMCILFTGICMANGGGFSGDFSQPGGAVYDSSYGDCAYDIAIDTITGGGPYIYVVGESSNGIAGIDYLTIKYDANGNMLNSVTHNGTKK
ncbi:MAG: hypothetical protein AUJ85_03110 [Elusimicrobia bacterium CG1_02_37_114]|nr:MAG: hypothetical protein AUJ85_03110 [Elusimicrobia bacterium CG1_02_37_114]PIV53116.1 MAG: hypothetical protein COS17_05575 [Elusimicrobia bacterium CG02_land_8_20_14_3_00_37_13]PIZ14414.1 MAG: hypothetical protein COY53_00095 [Elusimicrobia bacterium CG_4_10_14_0_8_um_filter_37_32]